MPLCRAASSTSFSVEIASEGYSTTQFSTDLNIAMSSRPIGEGPSCPMDTPAWEPQNLMFDSEYWIILIWSKARVKNAAKVDTKGIFPLQAKPNAEPTIFCSAMYISKNRSGKAFLNSSEYVELLTSPSSTTISGNCGNILFRALPYAFLVATGFPSSYASGPALPGEFFAG